MVQRLRTSDEINPAALAVMHERGVDISTKFPKPCTQEILQAADIVVTLGRCEPSPTSPSKRYLHWALDEPTGLGMENIRLICDEIDLSGSTVPSLDDGAYESGLELTEADHRDSALGVVVIQVNTFVSEGVRRIGIL